MNQDQRRKRILIVGVVMGLLALLSYVATLDESDPNVLPEAAGQLEQGYQ